MDLAISRPKSQGRNEGMSGTGTEPANPKSRLKKLKTLGCSSVQLF